MIPAMAITIRALRTVVRRAIAKTTGAIRPAVRRGPLPSGSSSFSGASSCLVKAEPHFQCLLDSNNVCKRSLKIEGVFGFGLNCRRYFLVNIADLQGGSVPLSTDLTNFDFPAVSKLTWILAQDEKSYGDLHDAKHIGLAMGTQSAYLGSAMSHLTSNLNQLRLKSHLSWATVCIRIARYYRNGL